MAIYVDTKNTRGNRVIISIDHISDIMFVEEENPHAQISMTGGDIISIGKESALVIVAALSPIQLDKIPSR